MSEPLIPEPRNTPAVGPGWYPSPTGTAELRWWDGYQWTEHAMASAPVSQIGPATPVYNAFIWLMVLVPLIDTVALALLNFGSLMTDSMRASLYNPGASRYSSTSMMYTPGYIAVQLLGFAIYAIIVVLAYLDWKRLGTLGFPRRFHWAWGFLSVVYVIGRSVVVRQQTGRGLAVIWVYIGVFVIQLLVVGLQVASAIGSMNQIIQQYSRT
ncbi:DUF2510 domain-containing protein [Subtercola sp. PAMC28395]|uniref:DUF2510 domain-containing protein n=1 Tax=Subtercola sp. PAMC28395 TaxID=2846775 RepID=UPI001C0B3EBC|nr:DUF2510 domain-containing protein [Subtercola sp. PAMC28395]QWT22716.1 DUF2510 domain-containing protein [Subtercola sp. PAMC28395]